MLNKKDISYLKNYNDIKAHEVKTCFQSKKLKNWNLNQE